MRNGIRFVNTSSTTAPAGAVLEPYGGYDENGFLRIRQVTRDNATDVYLNGPAPVVAGGYGECFTAAPQATARIDDTYLPLALRQTLGCAAGSWILDITKVGFVAVGQPYAGLADVMPVYQAGSSPMIGNTPAAATGVQPTSPVPITTTEVVNPWLRFVQPSGGDPTGTKDTIDLGGVKFGLSPASPPGPPPPPAILSRNPRFNPAHFTVTGTDATKDSPDEPVSISLAGGGSTTIVTGNVGPAASGSTADESTGTLYAANETGSEIKTLSSGVRVHENREAYLSQWGVVTNNDQRFSGDKRIVHADAGAGLGWVVGTFGDTRASVFPDGYTQLLGGSPQLLGPDTGTFLVSVGSNWFWSENRSYGTINSSEGASASSWGFVPPKGTTGELYAGQVVSANTDGKVATAITGAGLVSPTDTGYAGYYPAYSYYTSSYSGDEATLWIGRIRQVPTHAQG